MRWRKVRKAPSLDDFGHTLADAYVQGAHDAMHTVEIANVAADTPLVQ